MRPGELPSEPTGVPSQAGRAVGPVGRLSVPGTPYTCSRITCGQEKKSAATQVTSFMLCDPPNSQTKASAIITSNNNEIISALEKLNISNIIVKNPRIAFAEVLEQSDGI